MPDNEKAIKQGDFVLIDLWAKLNKPRAVYSDLTWTCFVGQTVPEKYTKIFNIVAAARDAGIQRVRTAFANNEELQGWQVDQATRDVIDKAGFGEYFCHRTGHSHRPGDAWQRRQHGQSRNARDTPRAAADMLLD